MKRFPRASRSSSFFAAIGLALAGIALTGCTTSQLGAVSRASSAVDSAAYHVSVAANDLDSAIRRLF